MDEVVVVPADAGEVRQVGGSEFGPVAEVVDLEAVATLAAGVGAATVAGHHRPAGGGGDGAGLAADVDDLAVDPLRDSGSPR